MRLPARRWKLLLQLGTCSGDANRSTLPTTNKCLFANRLLFVSGEREEAVLSSLLKKVTCRFKLPAHHWKRSLQLGTYSGNANGSTLSTANKCPFANLLLFASGEGHEVVSPSFATSYATIEASSPSLETLIASWCMQWECNWEHFAHGKQMPVCQSFTFCEWRGSRGNVALFYNTLCADSSFQTIFGNAHCELVHVVGMQTVALYPRQTKACLPIFYFL